MSLEELQSQLEEVLTRLQVSENKLEVLTNLQAVGDDERSLPVEELLRYDDIMPVIPSGDQIQLESYKSIPEFNGDKRNYRSWRNQVVRRMKMIERFKAHPKYEAALGIVRAKIVGAASDTLTNNQTKYNFDAIIERLDATYADQRPLYIIEAEMTSTKQCEKSLQEFHDAINQALNLLMSKIILTYSSPAEQKALINQAQIKAIRTFIIGLKSRAMRNILYGGKYSTLSQVYTSAQTVYYDDQYLQLEQRCDTIKPSRIQRIQQPLYTPGRFYPNVQNEPRFNVKLNCNQPQQTVQQTNKAEPMEVDTSNRFRQNTNWRQPNQFLNAPQKRENESARRYASQPNKLQRINQVTDSDTNPNEGNEGNICDEIPDDLISYASLESSKSDITSAFLCE